MPFAPARPSEPQRAFPRKRAPDNAPASEPAVSASAPGFDAGQAVIEQAGGLHVGAEVARRVACDAGLGVLYHGPDGHDGEVLDVGRKTRTVPTALRRALEGRDRNQCQFPGCSSRHCDAHHVEHWAAGRGDAARQSGQPVPPPPPRGARTWVSGGRRRRRSVPIPAPGWGTAAGGATDGRLAGYRRAAGTDRGAAGSRRHHHCPLSAHGDAPSGMERGAERSCRHSTRFGSRRSRPVRSCAATTPD